VGVRDGLMARAHHWVPRRTSNGWRAPLSFAQTRRSEERILERSIRLRSNEVWASESKRSPLYAPAVNDAGARFFEVPHCP
jgi:hypothetical protein